MFLFYSDNFEKEMIVTLEDPISIFLNQAERHLGAFDRASSISALVPFQ